MINLQMPEAVALCTINTLAGFASFSQIFGSVIVNIHLSLMRKNLVLLRPEPCQSCARQLKKATWG